MNKDVIYIEPEDDITDIITKIEGSKEKIVALVPPKKAGVFRSVVNIKLISKAGASSEKTIVLVTTDPSIIKLASATKIPVTKDLQTPPAIPTADIEVEETSEEEVVEEPENEEEATEEVAEEVIDDDSEEEKEEKPTKKEKKTKKSVAKTGNKIIDWVKSHKKIVIFGGITSLILIIFLIWAFAIAPSATVAVEIQTESKNFAENVSFVTDAKNENIEEGELYLQEKKIETVQEVKFEATGKKNKGEKAKGSLVVYAYFDAKGVISINAGSTFTVNGLSFKSNNDFNLSWNGKTVNCENNEDEVTSGHFRCLISGRIDVTAANPGTEYNIPATPSGWSTTANVQSYSDDAMTGGTDDIVTVVEQTDVEKAKEQLESGNESENKQKLYSDIDQDEFLIIESSFKQETTKAESTPAIGEEVKDNEGPVLKATTTTSVYIVEKAKVEEFISEKAKLSDDQKIYEIKNPFIESFSATDNGFTGRLKTSYAVGPKVTDSEIVDMVKGKGIGDAVHDLKNINGVINVEITPSYPWVSVIPGDSNRITVNIDIKNKEK